MIWQRLMLILFDTSTVYFAPFALCVLAGLLFVAWRKTHSFSYLLCIFIFGVYLLFAADVVFFPLDVSASRRDMLRDLQLERLINLIPFNFDFSFVPQIVVQQIFLNILLTVPFGFGMNFVAHVPARRVIWVALMLALGIEVTQFILSGILRISMLTRTADINDVLLNGLGVLIGYGIFRIFASLYLWLTRRLNLRHRGLSACVYHISRRASQA